MSSDHDHTPLDLGALPASRRDFLKLAGFSIAAAMLPSCGRGAEHRAVPFLHKPEEVTPGQSQYYATGCGGCEAGCGLLVKVRDGRPIKVEGNDLHPLSQGRTCAVAQASVLGLYDAQRLTQPHTAGRPSEVAAVDRAIRDAVQKAGTRAGAVRILTGTLSGPTARRAVHAFVGDARHHVQYDALSLSGLRTAHAKLYGRAVVPRYRFDRARALVAVDADFLGTWLSPVEFTRGYTAARSLEPGASFCHHTHFEARVSLTGGNADRRVRTAPHDYPLVLAGLAERVAAALGRTTPWGKAPAPGVERALLDQTAKRLIAAPRGQALVVCGHDDTPTQALTAYLNHLLGADDVTLPGRTVDLAAPSGQAHGDREALAALRRDIDAGRVAVLVIAGCNPVYDLPDGDAFAASLAKVEVVVCVAERMDETAAAARYVCPPPHFLAAWADAEPVHGLLTVSQPTLAPRGAVRPLVESLATWRGAPSSAYEQMRATWREHVFPKAQTQRTFAAWWNQAVHDGFARIPRPPQAWGRWTSDALIAPPQATPVEGLRVVLFPGVGLREGRHAHNPWLHELPDPIAKTAWQNTAALGPATAARLGVEDGDVVQVQVGAQAITLPAHVQPGQAEDVVAVAMGYGVRGTDRFANAGPDWIEGEPTVEPGGTVGVRAAPLLAEGQGARVTKTGERVRLARTQIYDRLEVPQHLAPAGGEVRDCVQETTLAAYRQDPSAGKHAAHPAAELWQDDHEYTGRHWELAINLSSCTGCSACVIACQSENNIPVVGKDEIERQREMHWLRIDRYFQGEDDDLRVANQPMMCQQCDHAPCETVCPVLATVHGEEGLNQQVYNRCVGTRYCSNNCPYKVRRFNWFDYAHDDQLQNMALNPDVTVRSRGVMEKCTFCVQRIQEGKATAKREGRMLQPDEVKTACQQVCPADAIVFGDGNHPRSDVARRARSPRAYRALEELNIRPSVSYLRRVKDRPAPEGHDHD